MSAGQLDDLSRRLRRFAEARDWEQFHSPKNLSMALIAECAELVEHFQWLTQEQSMNLPAEKQEAVALEMADIFIYLVRLADRLDVDLMQAAQRKIKLNEEKYPADKVRGQSHKYSRYRK